MDDDRLLYEGDDELDNGEFIEAPDSGELIDNTTARITLEITAESDLVPNAEVTLKISGEAQEEIDGGTVTIRLPTMAAMDYAGEGAQLYLPTDSLIPAHASWELPFMSVGDTWEETVAVPASVAGYYSVAVVAETYGPESDLGPYLSDEVYTQAWLFISPTDGQITHMFTDSIFPEDVRPVPGPWTMDQAMVRRKAKPRPKVYLSVVYYDGRRGRERFEPAVDARIWGRYYQVGSPRHKHTYTVPEDGIVEFTCPGSGWRIKGKGYLPETPLIAGEDRFVWHWSAYPSDCGDTITVRGSRLYYMPWRNLDLAAQTINSHFGYSRDRVNWKIDWGTERSSYKYFLWWNKIIFGKNSYDNAWVAAHEYTHALHHKSLGHYWKARNCSLHYISLPSSYTCAFKEGIADYGGNIGASDFPRRNWETFNTLSGLKPKIEGHVAALFHDLIDSENEEGDSTTYSSRYVIRVFKTCEVKHSGWRKRNDVGDFVWCLENRVNSTLHRRYFPGTMVPRGAKEKAWEPSDWDADHIRSTWLLNLKREE